MVELFSARPALTPIQPDGFGQSAADDLRFHARFRRCRRTPVAWRAPTGEEARRWEEHPIVGRFGDSTYAVGQADGRAWVVRDRLWFGWPDPPEYAFFAFDPDGAVWCAADFDRWPRTWTRPHATVGPP